MTLVRMTGVAYGVYCSTFALKALGGLVSEEGKADFPTPLPAGEVKENEALPEASLLVLVVCSETARGSR